MGAWVRVDRYNGWCFKEHIFGILVKVSKSLADGEFAERPLPRTVYQAVKDIVRKHGGQWDFAADSAADRLCDPQPAA